MQHQPASTARAVSVAVHSSSSAAAAAHAAATAHSQQQPSSHARRQRASHTVTSHQQQLQQHQQQQQENDPLNASSPPGPSSPYTDVYHHPAVEAYMAAHPRRTIPRFGPYLLLQTLGEGEFGKVKLGIHVQWGEEVAVKLIRRGNVDSAIRLSKVEREIEVLRTLKHPNIVRLYDVIETDKYIGIILEYASGGELFDHILAHRYLKEKDAAKLFSQLISGVWYIHQKKIVHRDLKLENLLLDRNRNVIITDFGFANRFEHKADDLMQTSCGSPCYAAPELVISEGLYVGSAVDIWSCGVILYAMLAGYLPFDDDPANPDGDNINLLYKYIVSTPLSFPDYISAEARDLLSMMLVPDPTRRANLDSVMRHAWLAAHAGTPRTDGMPNAFGRAVDELERAALDQHQQRRLAYQRQMRAAALGQNSTSTGTVTGSSGSRATHNPQHAHGHGREATHSGVPSRSHSTQPEHLIYTSTPNDNSASASNQVLVPATPNGSAGKKPAVAPPAAAAAAAYGSPSAHGITSDDPFGPPPGQQQPATAASTSLGVGRVSEEKPSSGTANAPATTKGHGHKNSGSGGGGGGFRHTIQVEYGENTNTRKSGDESRRAANASVGASASASSSSVQPQVVGLHPQPQQSAKERRVSGSMGTGTKPLPASPASTTTAIQQGGSPPSTKGLPAPPPSASAGGVPPQPPSKIPTATSSRSAIVSLVPQPPKETPTQHQNQKEKAGSSDTFGVAHTNTTTNALNTSNTSITKDSTTSPGKDKDKDQGSTASTASSFSKKTGQQGGHKKGQSSVDRFGFVKIFGGGNSSSNNAGPTTPTRVPSESLAPTTTTTSNNGNISAASLLTASPDKVLDKEKGEKDKDKENGGRKSRRNTLTVMVEPLRSTIRGRSGKNKTPSTATTLSVDPQQQQKQANASAASLAPPTSGAAGVIPSTPTPVSSTKGSGSHSAGSVVNLDGGGGVGESPAPPSANGSGNESGMPASTSKARKVMAWFRTKSKGRDSMGVGSAVPPLPPISTTFINEKHHRQEQEQGGVEQVVDVPQGVDHPALTLTTPTSTTTRIPAVAGVPVPPAAVPQTPTATAPTHPKRSASATTDHSVMTFSTPNFVQKFRNSVTVGGSSSSSSSKSPHHKSHHQPQQPQQQKAPHEKLRIHHGAVDQTTITTRPPAEVMKHVKEILDGMGVEIMLESEYKYRCVRQKRKKGVVGGESTPPGVVAAAGVGVNGQQQLQQLQQKEGGDVAAITMLGSAASNGVDKRGLPVPSQTSFGATGNMLRGLLMRRQSSQVSAVSASHHPPLPGAVIALDDENSAVVSPSTPTAEGGTAALLSAIAGGVETTYGDPTQDAGDEVRFSVELTRIDRLNHMFSLDIRRLKGNLRSYKFLYDTIRQRADLQKLGQ